MRGTIVRLGAAVAVAFCTSGGLALAGNGYVNMPERGCPGDFTPTAATAFPGFELSDINQDGVVCRMNVSSDPRRVVVIDNTANA
jgi:hypothetical protein